MHEARVLVKALIREYIEDPIEPVVSYRFEDLDFWDFKLLSGAERALRKVVESGKLLRVTHSGNANHADGSELLFSCVKEDCLPIWAFGVIRSELEDAPTTAPPRAGNGDADSAVSDDESQTTSNYSVASNAENYVEENGRLYPANWTGG